MAKRVLAILIVCMLAVSAANPLTAIETTSAGTVARKTLLELFTATWCGFCAAYGPNADKAYNELGPQQVILLRDQVGRDGLDTDETNARANFYRVTGVPTLYVNGLYAYSPAEYSTFVQRIRDMNSIAALFQVSVSAQVQGTTSQGAAAIEAKSLTSTGYGNLHLIVALFEKVVVYEGTNGVKTHRFVVRDYLFGEMGEQIDLAGFQTRQFSYPLALLKGSNPGDFGIVAWIQDFSTKEILQAESAEIAVAGQGQYTITASAGDGGTISPAGATTVVGGRDQMYAIVPAAGHHIQDVVIDGVSTGAVTSYTFTNVQANHSIQASFGTDGYTLNVVASPGGGGTVTKNPSQLIYTSGSGVQLTATPASGYVFAGWFGDVSGMSNPIVTSMTGNKNVSASFTALPSEYSLVVISSPLAGGTITKTPDQPHYTAGSVVQLTATPQTGYVFTEWMGDLSGNAPMVQLPMTSSKAVVAVFAQLPEEKIWNVVITGGTNGRVTPTGPQTVKDGNTLRIEIQPNAGYEVEQLLVDGVSVPLSSTAGQSYDLGPVTSNHQVQCSFVAVPVVPKTRVVRLTIGSTWLTVDGKQTVLDAAPVIQNSRTLLPIRAIVEAFGGTIEWHAELRVVTVYLNGHEVSLQIGNRQGYVDGVPKPIDVSDPKVVPIIISGRTFLPLRFVAENLGLQVEWDPVARTVTVTT